VTRIPQTRKCLLFPRPIDSGVDEARYSLYYDGSGTFDWTVYPIYSCDESDTSVRCSWSGDLAQLQPGVPYDIPKITVTKVNIQPSHDANREATFRVNGEWAKVNQ
jgi:hypothetical protein